MAEAFKDADIVYPKSWAPYKVMEKRTELLRANDHDGLKALEQACLAQNANHKDWHCTEEMMAQTKNGEALYMHCLPADITGVSCDEGEVTEAVFEKYRIATYKDLASCWSNCSTKHKNASSNLSGWPAGQHHTLRMMDKDRVCLLSH